MFLLIVLVVVVLLMATRRPRMRPWDPGSSSRPLDILKERYARGEIDSDTYNRMKDELK